MEITYASPSCNNLVAAAASGTTVVLHPSVEIIPPPLMLSLIKSVVLKWRSKLQKGITMNEWTEVCLPCYRWIRTYKWHQYLQADLMAGITVGIMLVPQSMSYAKLAGLQPIYGLYSGLVPLFGYAIFGSCGQLGVGPVSFVSLLVSNTLSSIDPPLDDQLYIELAIFLAFMVGIFMCILGLLRLGWLIRLISHSVISGFTTASAVVIALSQAKYFLGYNIDTSSEIIPLLQSIISGADKFLWPPLFMGFVILAVLLVMKEAGKMKHFGFLKAAGPLTAVVLGTTFVKVYHPSSISLVGSIPQGLPKFSAPKGFSHMKSLIPSAILISGVAILESVGIARALAAKNGYELNLNQELFGLGAANIAGSFFSSYPTTGAFSRSAVNHESGAKTGLSGIVMGFIMAFTLLFLTPFFEYIPQCALAAIVISPLIGLVDYEKALFLWRVDKKDFLLWMLTCLTTLFFGIEIGVLVGVGVSLSFVIHESANPHVAVLGRLPGTTIYRNIQQYLEAYTYKSIVIVRIDSPIYFANISFIKDRLREYEFETEVTRCHFVILEMASVTYIDSSAAEALKDLYHEYKSRDIQIAISNPNQDVLLTLARSGIVDLIGKEWYFVRVHDAVQVCLQHNGHTLNESHGTSESLPDDKSWYLKNQLKPKHNEADLEYGHRQNVRYEDSTSQLEPLLSRKL